MKQLLCFALLLLFACKKEVITPDPDPDPNCQEQNTIFDLDNQAAKIQTNLAFSGQIYDFQMFTPEVGYLFGASPINSQAVLLKTTDGALTFNPTNLQTPHLPTAFAFQDANNGIVAVQDFSGCPNNCLHTTRVYLTRDGGESWQEKIIPNFKGPLHNLQFDENGHLYALLILSNNSTLVVSKDGGETWEALFSSTQVDVFNDYFRFAVNGEKIYIAGTGGTMLVVNKQGGLQGTIPMPVSFNYTYHFFDAQNIMAGGFDGIFISTNGGNNWQRIYDQEARLITFESLQKGIAIMRKARCNSNIAASQDMITATTDGGQNWQTPTLATTNLQFSFRGAQRVGPGKYLAIFGRRIVELNIPQ